MAFLRYFLLVTLLASHANAATSLTCTDGGGECGSGGPGYTDVCEDLTGGAKSCTCANGYVRTSATECLENDATCGSDPDCTATPFTSTCGAITTSECECATGYEKSGSDCKVKPAVPVLSVTDSTALSDLISGQTYTLSCALTETVDLGGLPYSYTYSKGGNVLGSETLTTVTQADDGATDYRCTAEYDGLSTDSVDTAIEIKPATPVLGVSGTTPPGQLSEGADYTLSCVSDGAPAGTTYALTKAPSTAAGTGTDVTLTAVTAANTDGDYTCVATASTIDSDVSNTLTLAVGAAGKYCAANSDCSGGGVYEGTCTSNRCVCADGYVARAAECTLPGKACDADGDCTGNAYTGTCTDDFCVCADGYEAADHDCSLKKPTLTEQGGTPFDQFSTGGSYTLLCNSDAAGTTSAFLKVGGAAVAGGLLSTVSSTDDGQYTCTVTANGATSDASDAVTVTVGAAGTYCTENSECSGTGHSGTCTTAAKRCACDTNYEASAKLCIPSGLSCTGDGDCDGTQDQFSGTCGGDDSCDCATNYEKSAGGCEAKPVQPALAVDGGQPVDDLSAGATYTLTCTTTTTGTSFEFYKGNTLLDSATLTEVSASDDDGTYTCIAVTSGGVRSDVSADQGIEVKDSGKYCANDAACDGSAYTGTCTGTRCVCAEGRTAAKDTCSSAIKTATISIFSLLLAFMVSKLL